MTKADELVSNLLLEAGVAAPPVPVSDLARRRGAEVVYQPFDGDAWGLLFRTNGRVVLGVNSARPKQKQQFIIAHELGHLLLHEGRAMTVDKDVRVEVRDPASSLATTRQEIEANNFAAALLMPSAMVRAACEQLVVRGRQLDDEAVDRLADRFDVSSRGMGFRLLGLGFNLVT